MMLPSLSHAQMSGRLKWRGPAQDLILYLFPDRISVGSQSKSPHHSRMGVLRAPVALAQLISVP